MLYWGDSSTKRLVAGTLSDPPLTQPPTKDPEKHGMYLVNC